MSKTDYCYNSILFFSLFKLSEKLSCFWTVYLGTIIHWADSNSSRCTVFSVTGAVEKGLYWWPAPCLLALVVCWLVKSWIAVICGKHLFWAEWGISIWCWEVYLFKKKLREYWNARSVWTEQCLIWIEMFNLPVVEF